MVRRLLLLLTPALLVLGQQSWKEKKVSEWTEDDAKEVLSNSPWAKQTTPEFERQNSGFGRGGGMGRRGGWGGLGGGMGGPRMGGGGGWGGSGGGYPGGGGTTGQDPDSSGRRQRQMPTLTVRWESAMPIQSAHLKAKDNGPAVKPDEYELVVTGLSSRFANQDAKPKAKLETTEKKKKSVSSSSSRVISGESGPVVIFCFQRSKLKLAKETGEILLDAQIGRLKVKQSFFTDEMVYQGKLEI